MYSLNVERERERERDCNWFHEGQCKLKARQIRYINRLRPARATLYSVFAVAILRSDWRYISISTGHYYSLQLSFLLLFLYCLFSSAVTGLDSWLSLARFLTSHWTISKTSTSIQRLNHGQHYYLKRVLICFYHCYCVNTVTCQPYDMHKRRWHDSN